MKYSVYFEIDGNREILYTSKSETIARVLLFAIFRMAELTKATGNLICRKNGITLWEVVFENGKTSTNGDFIRPRKP